MKFVCTANSFRLAVGAVADAASTKNLQPLLNNYKVTAGADGRVTFQATDQEIAVVYHLSGATVVVPGEAILQGKTTSAIAREHKSGAVTVTAGPAEVTIDVDGSHYHLPTFDAAEFPDALPALATHTPTAVVLAGDLRRVYSRARFAITRKEDSERFENRGAYLEVTTTGLTLAGFNSLSCGYATCAATGVNAGQLNAAGLAWCLVPVRSLDRLVSLLSDDGEAVSVVIRNNAMWFITPQIAVMTGQMNGKFPQFRKAEQIKPRSTFTLTPAFFTAARRAAITTEEDSKRIDMKFGRTTTMTARGATRGSSESVVELPDYDGPEMTMATAYEALEGVSRAIGGDGGVKVCLTDDATGPRPIIFRYEGGLAAVNNMVERN